MTVSEKMARTLVKGFLHADGKRIVNGDGDEILLCGMGIGNWLVPEGYMWHFWGDRCNSPTKIEGLIRQLCGSVFQYAVQHNQNVMCGLDGKLVLKQQLMGKVIHNSRSNAHRKAPAQLWLNMLFQNRVILDVGRFSYCAFSQA